MSVARAFSVRVAQVGVVVLLMSVVLISCAGALLCRSGSFVVAFLAFLASPKARYVAAPCPVCR